MRNLTVDKTILINFLLRCSFQAVFIIVLASVLGLIFNHFRPNNGLAVFSETAYLSVLTADNSISFTRLSIDEALKEYNSGEPLFIDARSYDYYISGHIKGARSVPANRFDDFFKNALKNIAADKKIIVYCGGFNCDLAEEVANKLFFKGFEDIKIFEDGWEKWFEFFLPIEEGP